MKLEHIIPSTIESRPDPFGLRRLDFSTRVPECLEIFPPEEARTYINGCDFPESADDLLLAWEIKQRFDPLDDKDILDAMCGPGRLGRELLQLGTKHVVFHDGDPIMLNHAVNEAKKNIKLGQGTHNILLDVAQIRPENFFDLVVCHNSTHQLSSLERLRQTHEAFLRATRPGGFVFIADYQRGTSPEFLAALEERLLWTKQEIIPLLVPTFQAAFSKAEFETVVSSIPGIKTWSVTDATLPNLTPEMKIRVDQDPVKGHILDYSPISLRVIIQKKEP